MKHITRFAQQIVICALAISSLFIAGCQTSDSDGKAFQMYESLNQKNAPAEASDTKALTLHEGDIVRVSFPGSPTLNSVQAIRRDGKITLELAGEVTAAGLTPTELEKEILKLCGPQLISKEVVVSVDSSTFPIFVTGAVVRPGKILSDRPITALQAIMEAGGFVYTKADLASVRVMRQESGQMKSYKLNLKAAMQGKPSEPFDLKPGDIVSVPEKFSWF